MSVRDKRETMTKLMNCTPHHLNLFEEGVETHSLPPTGTVARVEFRQETAEKNVAGLTVTKTVGDGTLVDMPDPQPGVVFVVSRVVASHPLNRVREDVFSPGKLMRDENGKPKGADGLAKP